MKQDLIFRQLFDQETSTYTYLLADPETREAVLIDSVLEQIDRDEQLLRDLQLNLVYLLETHLHADHVTGAWRLKERTGAKIAVSQASAAAGADLQLADGEELRFGGYAIRALATPGHTKSCMSYYTAGMVFTGDVLFVRDVGRTDFQEGSPEAMFKSIREKLFTLPDETKVYPAHDYRGHTSSSIGEEKRLNSKMGGGVSLEEFKARVAAMKLGQPKKIHLAVPANLRCGRPEENGA